MQFILNDAEATMELGRMLAGAVAEAGGVGALCLYGELGSGKTTFSRGFVEALPGGREAEVASPSFTLCNEYPTTPRVLHADLYRLSPGTTLPEEVEDALEGGGLLLLEWPERLGAALRVPEKIDINFGLWPAGALENVDILTQPCERKRLASVTAHGSAAERLLDKLRPSLESRFASPPA